MSHNVKPKGGSQTSCVTFRIWQNQELREFLADGLRQRLEGFERIPVARYSLQIPPST
jgi:hypothetical protein